MKIINIKMMEVTYIKLIKLLLFLLFFSIKSEAATQELLEKSKLIPIIFTP